MRYSTEKRHKAQELESGKRGHLEFFRKAVSLAHTRPADLSLILVGGSDHRSLVLRRAQGVLRFDRRPSLWSHAAILHTLDRKRLGNSRGVEITLDPAEPVQQVPERNGMTTFALERYFDARRYPNVAFVRAHWPGVARDHDPRESILDKLREPLSEAERYPLWSSLGIWARYTYTPELLPNPLLENVVMPSAALCEYAFSGAGVDLTPGASANNCCPELLWSTFTHWQDQLAKTVSFDVYVSKGDPCATPQDPLSLNVSLV